MWLPEKATTDDQRQFRQEIKMLQSVGRHPHIVSLIGYCTRVGRLRLVVEYCAQGDLLNFLRKVMSFDAWNLPVNFGKFLDLIFFRHSDTVHNNTGCYTKYRMLSSYLLVKTHKYISQDAYKSKCANAFFLLMYSDNLILLKWTNSPHKYYTKSTNCNASGRDRKWFLPRYEVLHPVEIYRRFQKNIFYIFRLI